MVSMGSIPRLFTFVVLFFCLSHNGVEGAGRSINTATRNQQVDDNLELERELRILNKPPVKTIKTEEGDIFDCIDIYKQPAFDNPLLKNHKIQMRPSSSPPSTAFPAAASNVLKRFDCPEGTVPIRRTSKEDLIRAKAFSLSYTPNAISHPLNSDFPGQHLAVQKSRGGLGDKFYAVSGLINIANPEVGKDQFSGALVWAIAGNENLLAGWAVAPQLYGDNQTRLFTYWSADIFKTGCYNLLCPGFVQVDAELTIGSAVSSVSQFGGVQYAIKFTIIQDEKSGDWWLKSEETNIGYWPKSLFGELSSGATDVAWGGIVKGTTNGPTPQMGNGHFPKMKDACSIVNMGVMDGSREWSFDEGKFESYCDSIDKGCYQIEYDGKTTRSQGKSVFFGGPGGDNCGI